MSIFYLFFFVGVKIHFNLLFGIGKMIIGRYNIFYFDIAVNKYCYLVIVKFHLVVKAKIIVSWKRFSFMGDS